VVGNLSRADYCIHRFPLADVLWTFAMSLDTYLVVFHHFDAHSLQKLEIKYIGVISALTGIPAIVFLFIRTPARGPIYGGETVSLTCASSTFHMASFANQSDRFGVLYPLVGC
jgi:hypothetical protein